MPRGVRLNPEHDERTRAKIQTSQIINRLQRFIKSEVEMSPHQVTAALGLLRKTTPDLTAVELSGEVKQTYALDDKLPTATEWEAEHTKPLAAAVH